MEPYSFIGQLFFKKINITPFLLKKQNESLVG